MKLVDSIKIRFRVTAKTKIRRIVDRVFLNLGAGDYHRHQREGRLIQLKEWMKLQAMRQEGMGEGEPARKAGLDRKTVRKIGPIGRP